MPVTRTRKRRRLTVQSLEDRAVPATITGTLFEDLDGNGARDAGEPGTAPAGLTVYLDQNRNGVRDAGEATAAPDAGGAYAFTGLPDGTYAVRQELPTGWMQTGPGPATGPDLLAQVTRNFPSPEAMPMGVAWVNGSLYVVHRGASGVADNRVYELDPATGAVVRSFLAPGQTYGLAFDGTDLWGADSSVSPNQVYRFDLNGNLLQQFTAPGSPAQGVAWDAGSLWVGAGGTIYKVDPATGQTLSSFAAPGPSVRALAFDGARLWANFDNGVTDAIDPATGAVLRSIVRPGGSAERSFGLTFDGRDLWLSNFDLGRIFRLDSGTPAARDVVLGGADVAGEDFADFRLGSAAGRVFDDETGAGLSGWRVGIDGNGNGVFDPWERSVTTDAAGGYAIDRLRPGAYTVAEDLAGQLRAMPHWRQTSPAGGTNAAVIDTSGAQRTGLDFGDHLDRVDPAATEWASLEGGKKNLYTGLVWVDEEAVTGSAWTWSPAVNLVANSTYGGYDDWRLPTKDEALAAAVTQRASDSNWLTSTGDTWTSTTAAANSAWYVHMSAPTGEAGTRNKNQWALGVVMLRDTGRVIDDGAAGYADTGWTTKSASGTYGGKYRQKAAGTGSQTATWTFTGMEPGASYRVVASWYAASGNASNAPYTVLDNATALGTVAVNQKAAPNDFQVNGQYWEGLGTYTTASGTLKVRLTNQADGTVIADAVRVFRVYPSYASGAPLTAAGGPVSGATPAPLTDARLRPIVAEAVRRWNLTGLTAAERTLLKNVSVHVGALDEATLGLTTGTSITLDRDAAGYGWFVDPTPRSDAEFHRKGDQGEHGKMDLLTAVEHELGHVLGRDHGEGVMAETLATGTRECIELGTRVGHPATFRPALRPVWFLASGRR